MVAMIGANVSAVMTAAEMAASGKGFALNDLFTDAGNGAVFRFVQYGGTVTAGDVLWISAAGQAVRLSTSNDAAAQTLGVARASGVDDDFAWVQVYGPCPAIHVLASAAADALLRATGTAGAIDDSGTTTFHRRT